jgi:F-BAR domain only protein
VALAYNPVDITVPFGTETIRLENFPVLEKVAPNPTFISQTPEKAGEYGVNLSSIIRTAVAFKYQVHLEDSTLSTHAPITLTPAWKHEPTKTSVILTYAFNPSFTSADRGAVTLHNLIIIISFEGAKATACQSKPVGNFSKEKSMIYWKLGDVTLEADGAPGKLIARFTTDQEARPGSVEARWEIVGDNAIGLGSGLQLSQLSTISSAISTTNPTEADPFADEGVAPSPAPSPSVAWKDVPMVRRIVSGKYIAV